MTRPLVACLDFEARCMDTQKRPPRSLWLLLALASFVFVGYSLIPMIYCHYTGKEAMAIVTATSEKVEGGLGTEPTTRVFSSTL